jgi:hypothetical protein
MKALILALTLLVVFSGGCFLNPDDPAEVVHVKWETRTTEHATYYTATFRNKGEKDAKNVRVRVEWANGGWREGYTTPDLLTPGQESIASLFKRDQDHHPANANKVAWIKWDD